jgi:hypothetical protein
VSSGPDRGAHAWANRTGDAALEARARKRICASRNADRGGRTRYHRF